MKSIACLYRTNNGWDRTVDVVDTSVPVGSVCFCGHVRIGSLFFPPRNLSVYFLVSLQCLFKVIFPDINLPDERIFESIST